MLRITFEKTFRISSTSTTYYFFTPVLLLCCKTKETTLYADDALVYITTHSSKWSRLFFFFTLSSFITALPIKKNIYIFIARNQSCSANLCIPFLRNLWLQLQAYTPKKKQDKMFLLRTFKENTPPVWTVFSQVNLVFANVSDQICTRNTLPSCQTAVNS